MLVLDIALGTAVDLNLTGIEDSTFAAISYGSLGAAFSRPFFCISLLLPSQSVAGQQILLLNDLLLGQFLRALFAT